MDFISCCGLHVDLKNVCIFESAPLKVESIVGECTEENKIELTISRFDVYKYL
jgi:hypothetical protein